MRPLSEFPAEARRRVRFVLTDIDDTLTDEGVLGPEAYAALHRLNQAGFKVLPITGRPAGWCDHIARMWPVAGLVGENGAFYYVYDRAARKMRRRYLRSQEERRRDRERLAELGQAILAAVPGAAIAADQAFRENDLAIDFREDVAPLPLTEVDKIAALFKAAGAQAKVSSIHVNGWFGEHDKLTTTTLLLAEVFGLRLPEEEAAALFVGDSPNDAPMFGYFSNSIGVANVREFAGRLAAEPKYVAERRGGRGFAQVAEALLEVG